MALAFLLSCKVLQIWTGHRGDNSPKVQSTMKNLGVPLPSCLQWFCAAEVAVWRPFSVYNFKWNSIKLEISLCLTSKEIFIEKYKSSMVLSFLVFESNFGWTNLVFIPFPLAQLSLSLPLGYTYARMCWLSNLIGSCGTLLYFSLCDTSTFLSSYCPHMPLYPHQFCMYIVYMGNCNSTRRGLGVSTFCVVFSLTRFKVKTFWECVQLVSIGLRLLFSHLIYSCS